MLSISVNFKLDENARLLIFRVADDEASAALAAYRFLDWILEKLTHWVRFGWIQNKMIMKMSFTNYKYGSKWAKLISNSPFKWLPWFVLVFLVDQAFDNPLKIWLYGFVGIVLEFNLAITLLLFLTVLFAVFPLGWSAVLGVVTETVSFDSTPIGNWAITLLEPTLGKSELRHSQPYNSPQCLAFLVTWITEAENHHRLVVAVHPTSELIN